MLIIINIINIVIMHFSFIHSSITFMLMSQVVSGVAVESMADELHEHVYSLLPSAAVGNEVLSLLLELHVLEDEQIMLTQRINTMLMGTPTAKRTSTAEEDHDGDGDAKTSGGGLFGSGQRIIMIIVIITIIFIMML